MPPHEERTRFRLVGSIGTPGLLSAGFELNIHRRVDIGAELSLLGALAATAWPQGRIAVHVVRSDWGSLFVGGLGMAGVTPNVTFQGGGPIAGVQVLLNRERGSAFEVVGGFLRGDWNGLFGSTGHSFPVVLLRLGSGL